MRLAWFRPSPAARLGSSPAGGSSGIAPHDDTALLVRALQGRHEVNLVNRAGAHDFVWQHARQPHDLCVYELDGTPTHQFVAAYAVHFPGVVILRGVPRHDHALLASRLIVVPQEPVADAVADDYPGARVRTLTPGVEPLPAESPAIIEALTWPPDGATLSYAMSGFGAGRAVIVFDGPQTADLPSLDPQNWEPRAPFDAHRYAPICVSIDPRDAAHSLRLARRRLESDAELRARLGAAARSWWSEHATVGAAVAGFEALLDEARTLAPPATRVANDGSSTLRRILAELGVDERALARRGLTVQGAT
jgi:hypothetical protein